MYNPLLDGLIYASIKNRNVPERMYIKQSISLSVCLSIILDNWVKNHIYGTLTNFNTTDTCMHYFESIVQFIFLTWRCEMIRWLYVYAWYNIHIWFKYTVHAMEAIRLRDRCDTSATVYDVSFWAKLRIDENWKVTQKNDQL